MPDIKFSPPPHISHAMFSSVGTKCGEDNCKAVHFGSTFGIWNADDDCCEGTLIS